MKHRKIERSPIIKIYSLSLDSSHRGKPSKNKGWVLARTHKSIKKLSSASIKKSISKKK